MTNKITNISRILVLICAVLLTISIFTPLWKIDMDAPQYPEGLTLKIFSYKIGGQVEIINGLNHYIGMKMLYSEDFLEFTLLPYIIGFYALLLLLVFFVRNKKFLYFTFVAYVIFGIVAMIDFWRWEYNYGHNLNPHAAIVVPGMSYQPPLLGFKQLLNFGVYSLPDIGAWLFITTGAVLLYVILGERNILKKYFPTKNVTS